MAYDSPLAVSSVEHTEIEKYFEENQTFKGAKRGDAAKVLVSARFDELSKIYKPLKQQNKRTNKYRNKLDTQLKTMNKRILTLQE